MIRTFFGIIILVTATFIAGLTVIFAGIFNPYSGLIRITARTWTKSLLWIAGTEIEVVGLENIDREKQYIFMGNHQSHFDVLVLFYSLDMTIRFIAKKELFKIPVFGWALTASGMIKVDRGNRQKAVASIQKAFSKLNRKVSICIFPEGTRSPEGVLLPFKKGGFVMAIDSGIPIVPISISGTKNILRKHSIRLNPGKVKMVISPPVDVTEYKYENRAELADKVRGIVEKNIDENY